MDIDEKVPEERNYFSAAEQCCPCCGKGQWQREYLARINRVRARLGEPMYVTSAYRCPKHNKKVGGERNSEHLKGWGGDFLTYSAQHKQRMRRAAEKEGFTRFGFMKNALHIGGDPSKPPNCDWGYA